MPEISLLLTETPKRTPHGGAPAMQASDIDSYIKWYFSLSPAELYKAAVEGRL